QRCVPRLVASRVRVELDLYLAPVALLAVHEPIRVAEHATGRPVVAVSERELRRDRRPSAIDATDRAAEPLAPALRVIERQESKRPVGEMAEVRLRAAALHQS